MGLRGRLVGRPAGADRGSPAAPVAVPALIALLTGTALLLDAVVLHLRPIPELEEAGGLAVALTILAFAVTEAIVLHVELGRNAHTLSLAELALTVALFEVPAGALPVARLLGGGFVLLVVRRQPPLKAAFNASVWLVDIAVATQVFQALQGSDSAGATRLIVPALAAAVAAAAVDSVAVNAVIALTSGEMRTGPALRFLGTCVLGALASAMLAVVCVGALAATPWLLIPILLVGIAVMAGFRAFGRLRRRHGDVAALYDFTDALARTGHGDELVRIALGKVLNLLRVEQACLWLDPGDGQLQLATLHQAEDWSRELVPVAECPDLVRQVLDGDGPVVVRPGEQRRVARHYLAVADAREALLVSVDTRRGLRGVLAVANRLGDVGTFTDDDVRLLQTLGNHAGAALDNSRLVQQLDHDSTHDALTGLVNRSCFHQRLDEALAGGRSVGVLLMDLDRFKDVNDTLGHYFGDLLLRHIAARLSEQVRDGDVLARLGGDEFAVVISGLDVADVVRTSRRLREALAGPTRLEGLDVEVNASIGVAYAAPPAFRVERDIDATRLLQQADVAMYAAKRDPAGVHLYEAILDEHSPRRLALAGGLRAAIETGQLRLVYQPQVRLSTRRVDGVEALVRWDHPGYGEVGPDEFICLAEQTGQIRDLTRYVLEAAIAQCARWNALGLPLRVSVNVSVWNLLEGDLADAIAEMLRRHGVDSSQLVLEITESELMSDVDRTWRTLEELAGIGVSLSVDDFGTGYSSLAYLKEMPVAEVKVDKRFTRDLATDASGTAIVEAIVQLAHTLRLGVVAEGVEDEAAQRVLQRLACDQVQGYHISRPLGAADLTRWLADRPSGRALTAVPTPRTEAAQATPA